MGLPLNSSNVKYALTALLVLLLGVAALDRLYLNTSTAQILRCASSTVRAIESYKQAEMDLQLADANTLVLFDVDDTLTIAIDVAMRDQVKKKNPAELKLLKELVFADLPESTDYYFNLWEKSPGAFRLVEPIVTDLIKTLQNRNVKVFALTVANSASHYLIPDFPKFRFETLKSLGVDFSRAGVPNKVFNQFSKPSGFYPLLYQGVICTEHVSKGLVLGALLDYMVWKPSHVIFFDDTHANLVSVAQELCRRGIPFTGYHYLGAGLVVGKLDLKLTQTQFEYLRNNKEWLSDRKARQYLKN